MLVVLVGAVRVSSVRVNCPSDIMALCSPIVIVSNTTATFVFIIIIVIIIVIIGLTIQFEIVAIVSVS